MNENDYPSPQVLGVGGIESQEKVLAKTKRRVNMKVAPEYTKAQKDFLSTRSKMQKPTTTSRERDKLRKKHDILLNRMKELEKDLFIDEEVKVGGIVSENENV